jgi:hypothetical protein
MRVDPVGLLVIRAWAEEGSQSRLRAELKFTCDTTRGFEPALIFSEPDAVAAAVRTWLETFLAATGTGRASS